MFTAINQLSKKKVLADEVEKSDGPFSCESCKNEVVLRQGYVRIEHFAHKSDSACNYAGESEEHLQMNREIYAHLNATLKGKVIAIEMEKHLGDVRPDIYVQGKQKNIAIEVQVSALTPAQIIYRTSRYAAKDIYVLWVLPFEKHRFFKFNPKIGKEEPCGGRLKEYERVINYMYYKTISFWDIHHTYTNHFLIASFGDTYTDAVDFYDKDYGEQRSFGPKKIKTIKIIEKMCYNVKLKDMEPRYASAFDMPMGEYSLPSRKIVTYDMRKVTVSSSTKDE